MATYLAEPSLAVQFLQHGACPGSDDEAATLRPLSYQQLTKNVLAATQRGILAGQRKL